MTGRLENISEEGLTDRMLAALIAYDSEHPLWEDPKIVLAMRDFNVTHKDWLVIVDLFHQAEAVFHEQGRSIHEVYDAWRKEMPGGEVLTCYIYCLRPMNRLLALGCLITGLC